MIGMLDRKLLRDIWRVKGQVVAIALVVACGIATYIISVSTIDSLEAARDIYYDRYRVADIYAGAKRAPLVLTERLRAIEGVDAVYPRVRFGAVLDVPGMDEPATGVLLSIPDIGEAPLNVTYLVRGRMLRPGETGSVLAGEAFAVAHGFEPGDSLKAVINGRLRTLNIAGIVLSPEYVYSLAPGQMMPDDKRYGVLWMNRRALEAAVDMDGAFNDLAVSTLPGADIETIEDEIDLLLAPYGGIDAYPKDDQISYWFVENELTQLRGMAKVVPVIFLGVAAFLLNLVLSRQVSMEREQIGVLKAMGIANRTIGFHYLKFAAVIVLLGTIIGTGLGAWIGGGLIELYTIFFRFPVLAYVFDPGTIVIAIGISLIAAVIGVQGAVRKVIAMPPAEAMRPAAPIQYRRMILEKLGIEKLLSQPARMIVRHLERRPGRALLSISGISLSVAILITAMFPMDSIWHMIDVQYELSDRGDINLTFAEPKAAKALDEVTNLPGVLAAEPYRMVPARLIYGHRSERTAITGILPDGSLKRVIDIDLKPVTIPEGGLMLSEKLARILEIRTGEIVRVEVLEGRKPVRLVPVTGIVQEYMGTNAYMELSALNRLMGEAPSISGAALLTQKGDNRDILRAIKAIPAISGTLLKQVAIDAVREVMAQFIIEQTLFNTIFAGLIAFGVIYNTARISLSESARELASLRVLGLYRGEVAYILLGELAILILVSLPIGFALGNYFAAGVAAGMDTEMFRLPVEITELTYGYAVATVLIASLISGVVVWRRLQALDIVAVLKTRE